ncbi:DEAD/DEAH box helicase, partial [Streptomyces sp. NPDC002586]
MACRAASARSAAGTPLASKPSSTFCCTVSQGRDVLGRGRTGSGKTLAFGLPVLA